MDVRFFVPWRTDGDIRERLWRFCRSYWERVCPDIPIHTGEPPDGPFNRSAAINRAADGRWDVGIVLDSDVLAPPEHVRAAIQRATETGRLVLPFNLFIGLSATATQRVLTGRRFPKDGRGARFVSQYHESSVVVIPRPLWDEIGSFDERFVGWGQEDVAFAQSARILGGGIERVGTYVWHLEHGLRHQRQRRGPLYRANMALGDQYRACKTAEDIHELRSRPSVVRGGVAARRGDDG